MKKVKVVLSGLFYPMAILRYFEIALEARQDVELITVGPYTGNWIPWSGGMSVSMKYSKSPTIALDRPYISRKIKSGPIQSQLPEDIDLWLQVDAGWHFLDRPKVKAVVTVATDPHVLDYDTPREYSDVFFNMQTPYMQSGDDYFPYAFSPQVHYPIEIDKEYDVSINGLQYDGRRAMDHKLQLGGFTVNSGIGPIFDEYREELQKCRIGFTWSSKLDLIARVYEFAAMKMPMVINRVPDLESAGFEHGVNCMIFDTIKEGYDHIVHLLNRQSKRNILAEHAFQLVHQRPHTYDERVSQILRSVNLIS